MSDSQIEKPFKRLLLTGANGGLGKFLRDQIKPWADVIRISDITDLGTQQDGEELVQCDLADKAAVLNLLDGVDAVLHFGGISLEERFEPIMQANILGMHNLYEAVHKHGIKRVVFASSSHVTGYYPAHELIDADAPLRPDGFYGLSKCFGEALTRYYFDRFGIETVCIRIGSCFAEPQTRRMMVTYISHEDLLDLIRRSLFTPDVKHTIVFGMSDNATRWWDNSKATHLGFQAKDSSTKFNHLFPEVNSTPNPDDPNEYFQGGSWVIGGPKY